MNRCQRTAKLHNLRAAIIQQESRNKVLTAAGRARVELTADKIVWGFVRRSTNRGLRKVARLYGAALRPWEVA